MNIHRSHSQIRPNFNFKAPIIQITSNPNTLKLKTLQHTIINNKQIQAHSCTTFTKNLLQPKPISCQNISRKLSSGQNGHVQNVSNKTKKIPNNFEDINISKTPSFSTFFQLIPNSAGEGGTLRGSWGETDTGEGRKRRHAEVRRVSEIPGAEEGGRGEGDRYLEGPTIEVRRVGDGDPASTGEEGREGPSGLHSRREIGIVGRDLSRCAASIARRVYARDSEKLTVFRQQRNTCEYNRMLRRESIYADSNFLPTSPLPPRQNSFPFFEPVGRVPRIRRGCGQSRRKSCKLEKSKEYLRISQKSIDFFQTGLDNASCDSFSIERSNCCVWSVYYKKKKKISNNNNKDLK